jgi:hypothetical protein
MDWVDPERRLHGNLGGDTDRLLVRNETMVIGRSCRRSRDEGNNFLGSHGIVRSFAPEFPHAA